MPVEHGAHCDAPFELENEPTSHSAHCTSVLPMLDVEYLPGAHCRHTLAPACALCDSEPA